MKKLFTERQGDTKPRVSEELTTAARDALLGLVAARIDEEWLGSTFPEKCRDGYMYAGTDYGKMRTAFKGYQLIYPADISRDDPPTDGEVFDLLEFAFEVIAEPYNPSYHSYMNHHHYHYDQDAGRAKFTLDVNRICERNGIAFELKDGEIIRMAPAPLHDALAAAKFRTGDIVLDELLAASRERILHKSVVVRRESLEKLWDAWERLKTLEAGKDKKATAKALLDRGATQPKFRELLEGEARELTAIGNTFMIRHTETDKIPVVESAHVDYLYHRMFAIIQLLLRATGRLG